MVQENIYSLLNLGGTSRHKPTLDLASDDFFLLLLKRGANSCINHVTNWNYYVCVCNSRDKCADQLNPFKFQRRKNLNGKFHLFSRCFTFSHSFLRQNCSNQNFCYNEFIFNVLEQIQMITFKAEVCCERRVFLPCTIRMALLRFHVTRSKGARGVSKSATNKFIFAWLLVDNFPTRSFFDLMQKPITVIAHVLIKVSIQV